MVTDLNIDTIFVVLSSRQTIGRKLAELGILPLFRTVFFLMGSNVNRFEYRVQIWSPLKVNISGHKKKGD